MRGVEKTEKFLKNGLKKFFRKYKMTSREKVKRASGKMFKKLFKNFLITLVILIFTNCVLASSFSIQSPLPTIPTIVKKGSLLQITLKTDENINKFSVSISTEYFRIPLSTSSIKFNPAEKIYEISTRIPADTPVELYDLQVSSSSYSDNKERAVKVIENYKDTFSFIHITDIHCGSKGNEEVFTEVIEELNLTNPEFVLITGDITTECENVGRVLMAKDGKKIWEINTERYKDMTTDETKETCINEYKTFLKLLSKFRVPTYVIPGNHDITGIYNSYTKKFYEEMIGKRYYSFDYGNYHFTGCDNSNMMEAMNFLYPDAIIDLDKEQLIWLEEDLKKAQDKKLKIVFFHCPIHSLESKFKDLLKKYNTDMALCGHLHANRVISRTKPIWILTTSIGDSEWDVRGYRIIRIKDGQILSYTYNNDKKTSIIPYKLNYKFMPENNGKNYEVKCLIKNELNEDFKDALLRFIMPKDANYEIIGGKLQQEFKGEKFKVLYVKLDIPKSQEINIIVKKRGEDNECKNLISVNAFFQYDKKMLLKAKEEILKEAEDYIQYHITYDSIHDKRVTAILTIPKKNNPPYKVVIYQHGMSEKKDAEQVWVGTKKLIKEGFAVFSIDAEYHGERGKDTDFVRNLIARMQFYTFRDMFAQTVVDIRRGIDYLAKRKDIDEGNIGYIGISMGGMIGVIVSAIDERIKVPIFIVAGGNLKKMMPITDIITGSEDILKIIDPIYFVDKISPRPIFMINGSKDFTMMENAKDLYNRAVEPKKIVWIEADHIGVPFEEKTIKTCIKFLKENLNN